ncbi:MerR family transcriptional regulator [Modestobacter sp. VKM Ac-2979]|uniref:MerR family transcriptional regulator n=1 Tax=unclassified Modestobacter TaxID=2643866 RepID=UPI0022AB77DD|nr:MULTISPECIES: MerR family transcriptional regulator [unclassified Modestobacter]MCZ2811206.1 MerR family transcriptional regulator [Modestobacter sp. VKM Ac-2979]MCZ2840719.1 MerR family transcriptional regulator [Modestobacter sp. VKM Ac-2980]
MRIGEVAAAAGVSVRALRYYEEQGLLEAERSPSGQRRYPEGAVDRVHFIQQLYAAGLTSKDVLELLPCVHTRVATPAMMDRLVEQLDGIDRQIAELTRARERLAEIIRIGAEYVPAVEAAS